jgi:2-polyprenyl-3-methyl-5-hydroxy-6-metoxy-1,4-benzoquinol methylase
LLAQLQKKSFNQAKGIIFISNYAKKTISPFLTKSTAECPVIYHGIAPRFRDIYQGKSRIEGQNKPLDILYISTISMYKHQWKVVEAVAKLVNEGYQIRLNLVGDYYPPALKILRKALEQFDPNQQFVTLTGAIPFENINHYYQKADIFVFASTCENMPNILVEAMASGLAIAASMYEPMPEILKDAALYFDPLNPLDIYRNLKILIESPQKRLEIGTKAKKYAAAYSWERCAHETFSYLQKIANYTAITPKNAVDFHSETALQFSEKYYLSKQFQARFLVWTTLFEKYIQSPKTVLDVGCGSGIFSIYLAQKKCKVIGIDGSKKMIELCKQSNTTLAAYLTFHQMQLPWFNPQPFVGTEVIVCSSVLEYIADYQNVIADFANLLPSGGLLIVSMPNAESWYRILEKYIYQLCGKPHYYQFIQHIISEKTFTELLYNHNFTLKEIIYYPCTDLLSKTLNRVGFAKKYTNTMFVGVYQRN